MDRWSKRTSDGRTPRRFVGAALAMVVVGAVFAPGALAAGPAANCQPFSSKPCLLPVPEQPLHVKDRSSATGLRVDLPQNAMPTNTKASRSASPRTTATTDSAPAARSSSSVPGLDNPAAFNNTNPVRLDDMSKAFKPTAPIVVIDAATQPAAPDLGRARLERRRRAANTTLLDPSRQELRRGPPLHRRPAQPEERQRAARSQAPSWFAKLRDDRTLPASDSRRSARYGAIFKSLKQAGINRKNLYMAWDFTVASRQSLTSPMLSIRNNAFGQLGDTNLSDLQVQGNAPPFTVTSVQNFTPARTRSSCARCTGTFTVPCYLTTCELCDRRRLQLQLDQPRRHAHPAARQRRHRAVRLHHPARRPRRRRRAASLYGHGLLGSRTEVHAGNVQDMAAEHNFVFCATDWWGLAGGGHAVRHQRAPGPQQVPGGHRPAPAGRAQHPLPGAADANPDGFASDAAFQQSGNPLFDTSHLYYDGNSQGGIMGGITTAVAPDYTRAVLGVTGMDYGGVLLQRSTDFTPFAAFLYGQRRAAATPTRRSTR